MWIDENDLRVLHVYDLDLFELGRLPSDKQIQNNPDVVSMEDCIELLNYVEVDEDEALELIRKWKFTIKYIEEPTIAVTNYHTLLWEV
jgi:hypothetical protein